MVVAFLTSVVLILGTTILAGLIILLFVISHVPDEGHKRLMFMESLNIKAKVDACASEMKKYLDEKLVESDTLDYYRYWVRFMLDTESSLRFDKDTNTASAKIHFIHEKKVCEIELIASIENGLVAKTNHFGNTYTYTIYDKWGILDSLAQLETKILLDDLK